jgi:GTPase
VLNKLDMVPAEEREARVKDFVKRYRHKGPVFEISALTREGCELLVQKIYQHIAATRDAEKPPVDIDPRFDAARPLPPPYLPLRAGPRRPPFPRLTCPPCRAARQAPLSSDAPLNV